MNVYNVFMEEKYKLERITKEMEKKAEYFDNSENSLISGFLFACANTIRTSLDDIEDTMCEENCKVLKKREKMNKIDFKLKEIRDTFSKIFKIAKELEDEFGPIKNIEHLYYPHYYNKYDEDYPISQLMFEYKNGNRFILFSGLYYRMSGLVAKMYLVKPIDKDKIFDEDGIYISDKDNENTLEDLLLPEEVDDIEDIIWGEKNEFDWLCERLNMLDGKIHIEADINLNKLSEKDRKVMEAALDVLGIKY